MATTPMSPADAISRLFSSNNKSAFVKSLMSQYEAKQYLSEKQMAWVYKLAAEVPLSRTFTVIVKNVETRFVSHLSDDEALNVLTGIDNPSSFITSLLTAKALSEKQLAWVHKLALDTVKASVKPTPTMLPNIVALFRKAASGKLKKPRIVFDKFRLVKLDKAIMVESGNAVVCGYVDMASAELRSTKDMTDKIMDEIKVLEDNPKAYVTAYGQMTGNCCFCSHALTDGPSIVAGYGPYCAKHYGLPWGKKM